MNLKRFSGTLKHFFLKIKYKLNNYYSTREKKLNVSVSKIQKCQSGLDDLMLALSRTLLS